MSSTISYKVVIYILTIDKLHKECIIAYNLAIVLMLYGSIEYCVGNACKKKKKLHAYFIQQSVIGRPPRTIPTRSNSNFSESKSCPWGTEIDGNNPGWKQSREVVWGTVSIPKII